MVSLSHLLITQVVPFQQLLVGLGNVDAGCACVKAHRKSDRILGLKPNGLKQKNQF
jgi:hypothetical protein